MPEHKHTLCDCCGGFEPCTPHMLGKEREAYFGGYGQFGYENDYLDEDDLPDPPIRKEEMWLCAACHDPILDSTGILPTCVHCGLALKPGEYRQQLCDAHNN